MWYLDGGGGCRGVEVVGEGGGEAHRGQYGDPERCHRVGAVPKGVHPVAAPLPPLPRRSSRDRRACPAAAAPFPSSCRGGAGDFTAVSFSLSSFSREVLTEEREVSPCRSSLLGWDPPVGESRESDMARANWSTHVTERGSASQDSGGRVHVGQQHVGQQMGLFRPIRTSRPRRLTQAPTWQWEARPGPGERDAAEAGNPNLIRRWQRRLSARLTFNQVRP